MLEGHAWNQPDVLGEFSLASVGSGGNAAGLSLLLKMADSGYRFDLDCTPGSDGKPDATSIVETLANVFRYVFRLVSGKEVFSSAQRNDLLARASAWAEGLMQEAGVVIPRAEVDLESAQWVESSLGLWVKVYSEREDKYALLVPVGKQGKPDFSGIDRVAAKIAQDWCQRVGMAKADWLCVKMSAEIGLDAREYVNWILEEEAKLLIEFFDALNHELAGHLKDAKELHQQAVKWRADFDTWAKGRGNFNLKASGEALAGAGVNLAAQVPQMPATLKSTFSKIWDGLNKLPGAVYKGLEPKTGEIAKGLEFGFKAAGVVIEKTGLRVLKDVAKAVGSGPAKKATRWLIKKLLLKRIGARKVERLFKISDKTWKYLEKTYKVYDSFIDFEEYRNMAMEISSNIEKIKSELYVSAGNKQK